MTIKELANKLESQINTKLEIMTELGKESKSLQLKLEAIRIKMATLWVDELKGAENIIRLQNPMLNDLFNSLEDVYEIEISSKK